MNIAIIGAGYIGATLARKLVANGHHVNLANSRGPESIQEIADDIGAVALRKEEAIKNVEVIILSIPFARSPELASLFSDVPENVVVIDTSNYYPFRDGNITEVDEGKPEGVWVSEQIGRPVVKAWNAVLAETLVSKGTAAGTPGRIALPVAGDDEKAKGIALLLVDTTGFDALDAGTLADSWRHQPGTPGYCTELTVNELSAALAAADKQRAPHNRDALRKQVTSAKTPVTHNERVALNRDVTA